jgi:hypothetical protein
MHAQRGQEQWWAEGYQDLQDSSVFGGVQIRDWAGAGIGPVSALWGWRSMSHRAYGNLPESVFIFGMDGVRQAFQQTAASQLWGVPEDYGLHSLRAGAATEAEEAGWSISEIMFMERWSSPTVLVYLETRG